MKSILLIVGIFFAAYVLAQTGIGDDAAGASGSISVSGAIGTTNVKQNFRYGVEIKAGVVSGSITTISAQLRCSNDKVNYSQFPLAATGDARTSGAVVVGTASASGSLYLYNSELACNYVEVFYTLGTGGGSINIQEVRKVHGPLY